MILDVAVLHGRRFVPALDLDEARLFDRLGVIARRCGRMLEDVVGERLVQLRRAGLHGLLHVEHERQLLILDLDGAHGLHGRDLVLGDDSADIVAVIAHVPVEQVPVGNVLMGRVHRPRVAGRGERDVRHVEAGQDLHNAGNFLGLADVDRLDEAMRNGRMLDSDEQRILRGQIIIVFCPAGRLVKGVDTNLASAYDVHSVTSICRITGGFCASVHEIRHFSTFICSYCSIFGFEEKVKALSYFLNNGFFRECRKNCMILAQICKNSYTVL